MILNISSQNIPHPSQLGASSVGNTGIKTTADNSGVQSAQQGSSLAQAHGTGAKQVSANEMRDMADKFGALSVEVQKLREEAESIKSPKGFGNFINGCKNATSKLFGFIHSPTDRLNWLENQMKILGHQMEALQKKMTASESSGLRSVHPAQVHADMGVQSSSDDLNEAKKLATTSAQCVGDIHDEVKTQLTTTSRPEQSFEPFMDRKLVEIMFGPQPDLPAQTAEVPAGVGGIPPPPPPPPPPPGSTGAPKAGGAVDQKAAFASDVALFQKLQTEGRPVSFSRQIPCADGKAVSINVSTAIHSKAEEAAYQRQLQAKATELGTMIRNLREGPEGLKQQTLGIIATMTREVASGARGTQTITLPSGMQVTANIKLPCDYSQSPLQFFNDLERLKTDGLVTDKEYGQFQSIKTELTAKQTEFTNALADAKALETVKQELEMASKQAHLPKGSPTYDATSSILSQRSQLPAELQSYWNNFSYESMDASLKRAQDLHQQKIDQKVAQLEQKRVDVATTEAQYVPMKAEFLRRLESSPIPDDQKVQIKKCIDLDFVDTKDNKIELLGDASALLIPLQKYDPVLQKAFAQLKALSPKLGKEQIKILDKEVQALKAGGSSAGLQAAIIGKQVQISLEPNLFKVAQQIRGGTQFDSNGLSKAVQVIKADRSGGTSREFAEAKAQLEAFTSQLGYNAKNTEGNLDMDKINGLMNLVKHLQTHNSPEHIHTLAENIAQSRAFAKTPDTAGLNNAFFMYIQKMA